MLRNIRPEGPVDFVLIAMEPSLRHESATRPDDWVNVMNREGRNFSYSLEDFILHFCASEYLCQGEQTYYITDLSKGAMHVKDAGTERNRRYERWLPLLKDELQVVGKPGETRIVAIGSAATDFLKDKHLCKRIEGVLHYSARAASRMGRIQRWIDAFPEFCQTVSIDQIMATAKTVMELGEYSNKAIRDKIRRLENGSGLTESRKTLMFYYRNKFEELRTACHIVLSPGQ